MAKRLATEAQTIDSSSIKVAQGYEVWYWTGISGPRRQDRSEQIQVTSEIGPPPANQNSVALSWTTA